MDPMLCDWSHACLHALPLYICMLSYACTCVSLCQGFRTKEEVQRFSELMEEMCYIVATKHGGSLKVLRLHACSQADAACYAVGQAAQLHGVLCCVKHARSCSVIYVTVVILYCHCLLYARASTALVATWHHLWRWSGAVRRLSSCGS